MNLDPAFLTVAQVKAVHQRTIAEFGGIPGLRDPGLLESAVLIPAAQYGGKFLHGDIPTMAAATLFHLCRNHPFMDGNTRTALASAEIFLLLNDCSLEANDEELERLTLGVAEGSLSKDEAVLFFRQHAKGLDNSKK